MVFLEKKNAWISDVGCVVCGFLGGMLLGGTIGRTIFLALVFGLAGMMIERLHTPNTLLFIFRGLVLLAVCSAVIRWVSADNDAPQILAGVASGGLIGWFFFGFAHFLVCVSRERRNNKSLQ